MDVAATVTHNPSFQTLDVSRFAEIDLVFANPDFRIGTFVFEHGYFDYGGEWIQQEFGLLPVVEIGT